MCTVTAETLTLVQKSTDEQSWPILLATGRALASNYTLRTGVGRNPYFPHAAKRRRQWAWVAHGLLTHAHGQLIAPTAYLSPWAAHFRPLGHGWCYAEVQIPPHNLHCAEIEMQTARGNFPSQAASGADPARAANIQTSSNLPLPKPFPFFSSFYAPLNERCLSKAKVWKETDVSVYETFSKRAKKIFAKKTLLTRKMLTIHKT